MKPGPWQPPPEGTSITPGGDRSALPFSFTPPEPFADRYTELRLLGRGGFGDVYRAWDTQMERAVALKLLKRDLGLDADWRKRFRQEATRNLLHPNITINFDIGEYQRQLFIVMELVEGEPLSRLIDWRAPLSDPERLSLIEQLCDGVHYAHTQKVVHRDIKPANLMVCEKEHDERIVRTLKILDFGIAKVVSTEETSAGSFMFSPPYVSPEQVRGEPATERSDMFAVGAVAYELLSYQKAFDIKSKSLFEILIEVQRKNAEEPHRSLIEIRPDIDPQLSAVIDRALAKSPADRFRTMAEMGRELRKIRERLEDSGSEDASGTLELSATVQTAVREARQALETGDPTAALSKIEKALLLRLNRSERRILEEILADARERHALKSGARHEQEQAAAAAAIAQARAAFSTGNRTAAVDRLSLFKPIELVIDELETLRTTREALAEAERTIGAGTIAQSRDALDRLERSCQPELVGPEVARLRRLATSTPAAADEDWKAVTKARADFARGRRDEALAALNRLEPYPFVTAALQELQDAAAAIERTAAEMRSGTVEARTETLRRLEAYDPPELVVHALEEFRAAAARDASATTAGAVSTAKQRRSPTAGTWKLATAALLVVVTGLVVVGAYKWWPFADTPRDSSGVGGAESSNPSATVRQRVEDLWTQGLRDDAINELEGAVARWPQDGSLAQTRERFAAESKAASDEARLRAEAAGGAADQLYKIGMDAAARAQAHTAAGRHFDSIRAYMDAATKYDRALENAGPVAEVDGFLKSGDRTRGLDALVRGLNRSPDNAQLRQRLETLRAAALKDAQTAHQTLTRNKDFDETASDYQTTRKEYDGARSQAGPDSVRRLWQVVVRLTTAAEKMSKAAALRRGGLEHARAGRRQEALASLRDLKLQFAGYRATRELAQDLRNLAASQAQQAKRAANEAGATAQTTAFAEAMHAEQQAAGAATDEAAIEFWREAAGFYALAEKEARRAPPATNAGTAPDEKAKTTSASPGNAAGPSETLGSGSGSASAVKVPPPPVKPPDNPVTPGPPPLDEAAEQAEVLAVIEQYKRGYENMDVRAVLTVYPTFSKARQKDLEQSKADCKAFPVRFIAPANVDFTDGKTAVVSVRAQYGCERKSGGVRTYDAQTEFFRLQRENGRWLIREMPGK